jgi:hypothetical protein
LLQWCGWSRDGSSSSEMGCTCLFCYSSVFHAPREKPDTFKVILPSLLNRNPASAITPAQWPPDLHQKLPNCTFYNSTKSRPFAFKLKIVIDLEVSSKIAHSYPCIYYYYLLLHWFSQRPRSTSICKIQENPATRAG